MIHRLLVITILWVISYGHGWSAPAKNPPPLRIRILVGSGAAWAVGSLRTEKVGSADFGESITFRVGLHYHPNWLTYLAYEAHKIKIERDDFASARIKAFWEITEVSLIQRYLFRQKLFKPYAELGLALCSADLQTNEAIHDVTKVGDTRPGGSWGIGIEITPDIPSLLEMGFRLHYFSDTRVYDNLDFTYFNLYLALGFTFN